MEKLLIIFFIVFMYIPEARGAISFSADSLELTEESFRRSAQAPTVEERLLQLDDVWRSLHSITKSLEQDAKRGTLPSGEILRRILFTKLATNADFYASDPLYQSSTPYYNRVTMEIIADLMCKDPLGQSLSADVKNDLLDRVIEDLRHYNNYNEWLKWLDDHRSYWRKRFEDSHS